MWKDPIVEETRQLREEYAAKNPMRAIDGSKTAT